ncbi:MAG: Phospholipase D1 [Ramalina farinacea]|uniref:Phospholipase n=1 Tax=Ramalina farinacea TaxID=258253 RepID=A0AA43TR31_9LECA|nr:Phospholipase D1 [Ramalina farinacea]
METSQESPMPSLGPKPRDLLSDMSYQNGNSGIQPKQVGNQEDAITEEPEPFLSEDMTAPETGPPRAGTPPARPSVQFVRSPLQSEVNGQLPVKPTTGGLVDVDASGGDRRGGSLFTKLRALATTSNASPHVRSYSGSALSGGSFNGGLPQPSELTHGLDDSGQNSPFHQDSDADADDSGTDTGTGNRAKDGQTAPKRKRQKPRYFDGGSQTAPTTPKMSAKSGRPSLLSNNTTTITPTDRYRASFLPRRATMTDVTDESRQGVSEDEGRQRIDRGSPWRRGSSWVHSPRGLNSTGTRKQSQQNGSEERRPSNFRRITGLASGAESTSGTASSAWRIPRGERATTVSAAKWKQLKAGLKMLGQRRKAENTIDHAKSAELLAELTAGAPAALIVASMFQRDDHGNRRIPILLEQLKVRITDSKQIDSKSGDRHVIFRIEMEYGNGLTRMKWVIHRALRDFANLHVRYKVQISTQKYIQLKGDEARTKLPHFPRSTFPYLRGIRGLDSESEEEADDDMDGTATSGGDGSGPDRTGKKKKKKARPALAARRKSSVASQPGEGASSRARREAYPERQRKKLETYLQQMIRYLIFRPESNRLCKFLELSALGVRLAAEGSYHGKEGLLVIKSGKGVDFRKAWTPSLIVGRHGPKWFSVRHSYVVCVDSPEAMNIYDVFLVDSNFRVSTNRKRIRDQPKPKQKAKAATDNAAHSQHHSLKLYNSERKLKLLAKNERQLNQFQESILFMCTNSPWAKPKRFDSFAPVRTGVFAQWLVDGRDYMWNVSRAISMAKDVIYIHDWWLSPELYLRRPAAISQKWRLDRLLQRKARDGVKVFVIMYRNINSAIPIDSEYSKFSLLDLHPNIFVQRSPNQFRQNTFFWAHHEKLCLIDHMVAFIGGIDLCFGRWDTPQHTVVDDKLTGFEASDDPKDADHCQLWPGKDYSNPRVQDFYALDKPYEEMYDRAKVPRMPWHDIHMQVVGQPARDLTRHFVQRWNYILRQRKPTRPTPFLLPPPDFNPHDLKALGLDGTCEVQILRSACEWSLGTPGMTEHSIMNAYMKLIEESDHFVYIENQFFISSCEVEGTRMENRIGDALVERIIRAAQRKEDWRAVIVIPLMPGFQNTVDSPDGTSVRLIMQCQFRSICRGEASIFGRVRAAGVEPEDFIQFYSLRSWGKIGPNRQIVTEQLYIHAKCMIVDDRVAIIGSANINERSMLGSRDSECAAVIRDKDMLQSTMNGQPYRVGRFPHTLRMRLMREHLGIDVDEVMDEDQRMARAEREEHTGQDVDQEDHQPSDEDTKRRIIDHTHENQDAVLLRSENMSSFNHDVDWEQSANPNLKANRKLTEDARVTNNAEHRKSVDGEGHDAMKREYESGNHLQRDSVLVPSLDKEVEILVSPDQPRDRPNEAVRKPSPNGTQRSSGDDAVRNAALPPEPSPTTSATLLDQSQSSLPPLPVTDDTDIGGPKIGQDRSPHAAEFLSSTLPGAKQPAVDKDCMRDPLNDAFFLDTWHAVAENNTKLYRQVFRCMPDSEVKSWKEYKEYAAYAERFSQSQGGGQSLDRIQRNAPGSSGPPGSASTADKLKMLGPIGEKAGSAEGKVGTFSEKLLQQLGFQKEKASHVDGSVEEWAEEANKAQAERHAQEAREREKMALPSEGSDHFDEKDRPSNDLRPFPSLIPSNVDGTDNSSTAYSPSPGSLNYSEALMRNTSTQKRRRRATTRASRRDFHASDDIMGKDEAEDLMHLVQGHLVLWPYDWLAREEQGGNWLYSIDGLAPLEI